MPRAVDDARRAARRIFGARIVELRERRGMTQTAAAEHLEVTKLTMHKWEAGDTEPDVLDAQRLADLLGVGLEVLTGHASVPPPRPAATATVVAEGRRARVVIECGDNLEDLQRLADGAMALLRELASRKLALRRS